MKKSLSFLISAWSLCLLNGCGGGSSTPAPVVATHFSVTPSTSTPVAGASFSITVTALSAAGQTVTSYSAMVHFTSSDSQAVLPADSNLSNGTGTFSATLKTAGAQTITVSDAASLTGTSAAMNVGASASTRFSIALANNFVSAGAAFQFTVAAMDGNGNTVTSYAGTVRFTSSDGQAALPANSMLTNGVGNFSATLKTLGGQTIMAADAGQNSINGTSNVIYVSGPATHLSVGNTSGGAATRGAITLLVSALDASNNVSTGYIGTVKITSSDKNAILPANGPLNSGQGNFQFTFETSGNQTITATDTVTAAITGTSSPIAVTATAPLAIASGNPPNGTVGSSYGTTSTQYLKCHFRPPPLGQSCSPCVPNTAACGGSFPRCPAPVTCVSREVFTGFELTGSGGVPAYSWAASSLPPGLAVSTEFGRIFINGTPGPGTAATYKPTVTLSDSGLPPAPFSMTYSIVISNPPPPVVDSAALLFPGAAVNLPFSFTFTATGGLPPYQNWKESGTLPAGIAPLTTGGALSGTPTATGTFPISVTVVDSLGQVSAAQGFTLQVFAHGFKAAATMAVARTSHTATLLTDGTVLVAGGLGLSSAEKYDPGTGKFTPTNGNMSVIRYGHTATLLAGGKVLLTGGGGLNGDAVLASAELFDPSTGKFTPTAGSMSVARTGHNATLLSDGKVLITGGDTTTAELFDPSTGNFTPTTGKLGTARNHDTATLLPNDKVLISGGFSTAASATAELYDPTTETFSATGSMSLARVSPTATLLDIGPNSGKVLIAGGASTSAVAELYDPATGNFSSTGTLAGERAGHTATLLNDGMVLVAGGSDFSGNILAACELFDATNMTFAGTGGLQTPREANTATLLKDGTVLVTGGVNQTGTLATAELYQ